VLLVEDDEDSRVLLAEGLGRHGADVVTAETGAQALAILMTLRPDVLVSDLELVRARPGLRALPGIALTGHGGASHRDAAFRAGFAKHLLKPTRMTDLVAAILEIELHAPRPASDVARRVRDILVQLSQMSPCRFLSLLRFRDDNTLSSIWTHDRENPEIDPFPLGLPIQAFYCSLVREHGKTCAIEDARTDPRTANHAKRDELASYIGVPVHLPDGRIFGTVSTYDAQPHIFSTELVDSLERATRDVAMIVSAVFDNGVIGASPSPQDSQP
jgi:CheY-like chemotaxis protein